MSTIDTKNQNLQYAKLSVNLFSTSQIVVLVDKGCLSIAKNSNDEVEKMEYLIKGLNSYNSFLKRDIKLEINEIKKIHSNITTHPAEISVHIALSEK